MRVEGGHLVTSERQPTEVRFNNPGEMWIVQRYGAFVVVSLLVVAAARSIEGGLLNEVQLCSEFYKVRTLSHKARQKCQVRTVSQWPSAGLQCAGNPPAPIASADQDGSLVEMPELRRSRRFRHADD